jgi:hypothetical protein
MDFLNEIKKELFTIKGICITLLTNLVLVGLMSTWVFINVQVLGNDVALSVPSSEAMQNQLAKRR